MSLKHYYNIFGLQEGASQDQIKKRYRQLAMQYHPDKCGGDTTKFVEIKEAYEYLTGKRVAKVTSTFNSSTPSRPRRNTDNAQKRAETVRNKIKQEQYKEHLKNLAYLKKLTSGFRWKIIKTLAIISPLLICLSVLDALLPQKNYEETLIAYDRYVYNDNFSQEPIRRYYFSNGEVIPSKIILNTLTETPDVIIAKTPILHITKGFIVNDVIYPQEKYTSVIDDMYNYPAFGNIYSYALILIPFLITPLFAYFNQRPTPSFTVAYFSSLYATLPLLVFLLVYNNNWLHIITLGFY